MASIVRSETFNLSSGTTATFAIDGSGGNLLVVIPHWRRNSNQDVTGVTHNGDTLTQLVQENASLTGQGVAVFYNTNPDQLSGNVVVSFDVDLSGAGCTITAIVISGADTDNPFVGTTVVVPDSGSADVLTANITVSGSNDLAIGVGGARGGGNMTVTTGAGQTDIDSDLGSGSGDEHINQRSSYEVGTGASQTLSYTYTPPATGNGAMVVFGVRGTAGGGGPTVKQFGLLGVG